MNKYFTLINIIFLITLILYGCSSGSFLIQKTAEFENKLWLIQSINYNDLSNPDGKLFLKFSRSTKRFSGFGGCNNILGSYSITGSDIKIIPASSKDTCETGMETEENILNILENAVEFRETSSSGNDYFTIMTLDGSTLLLKQKK